MLPTEVIENLYFWKQQYDAVLLRSVDGQVLVYRAATPEECEAYKVAVTHDPSTAEDWLLRRCVLFYQGTFMGDLPAGVVTEVLEEAIKNSLYSKEPEFIEEFNHAREFAKTIHGSCIALVAKAFNIDPDDISRMSLKKLLRYTALAEAATGSQITIESAKQKPATNAAGKVNIANLNKELSNMGVWDQSGVFNTPPPPDVKIPQEVIDRLTKQKPK